MGPVTAHPSPGPHASACTYVSYNEDVARRLYLNVVKCHQIAYTYLTMVKANKIVYGGNIPVVFLKEGETFVAYSPALDLSTCGRSFDEARENFAEALELFFAECLKRGTLEQALRAYGWQRSHTKPPQWEPPMVVGQETLSVPVPSVN